MHDLHAYVYIQPTRIHMYNLHPNLDPHPHHHHQSLSPLWIHAHIQLTYPCIYTYNLYTYITTLVRWMGCCVHVRVMCVMCEVSPPHRRSPSPVVSVHLLSMQFELTALHAAVVHENVEIVRLLLEHGADANIKNKVPRGDVYARVCVYVCTNRGGMGADWGDM